MPTRRIAVDLNPLVLFRVLEIGWVARQSFYFFVVPCRTGVKQQPPWPCGRGYLSGARLSCCFTAGGTKAKAKCLSEVRRLRAARARCWTCWRVAAGQDRRRRATVCSGHLEAHDESFCQPVRLFCAVQHVAAEELLLPPVVYPAAAPSTGLASRRCRLHKVTIAASRRSVSRAPGRSVAAASKRVLTRAAMAARVDTSTCAAVHPGRSISAGLGARDTLRLEAAMRPAWQRHRLSSTPSVVEARTSAGLSAGRKRSSSAADVLHWAEKANGRGRKISWWASR